jgi:hypothetical protein
VAFPLQPEPFYRWGRLMRMRKTLWIWFAGCAAWIVDGFVSLRYHDQLHARLAFCVAMVFLAAGFFYRKQKD